MNFFLLPGNPPSVHFYEEWGREIQSLHPEARIKVSLYPDPGLGSDSVAAMAHVLSDHRNQFKEFRSKSNGPVTLLGHSLGGYFALKLLEENPDLVHKAILLHPFLRVPSLKARAILAVAGSLHRAETFQKVLIKFKKALELFNADLPHVSNEEILRSFHLARHERATIDRDSSPIVIKPELRMKLEVYYNKGDLWCTPHVVEQLKSQIAVHECSEPHGFITRPLHRKNLWRAIQSPSTRS